MEISCTRAEADHKQLLNCKTVIDGMTNDFDKITKLLSISGNEVRLKILFLLNMEKELCPCDLSDILGMSVPAVSQHIRKMKDAAIAIANDRNGITPGDCSSLMAEIGGYFDKAASAVA